MAKAVDSLQQRLTSYACELNYDGLSTEAVHAAKVRIIDTLGALIAGFFGEPCRIARNVAAQMPNPGGATVIGTRIKTMPDMVAFVNATTACCVEMNDNYHAPGGSHGHPSDTVTPVLAVAEHAQVNGRDFITGVVLAYEIYQRIFDVFHPRNFDQTNLACLGTAAAAGKLLNLSAEQLSHCISIAVVPNAILAQMRATTAHLSIFKAAAAGYAGRAGVFAALLANAGMEGPHLPFEGKAGWCKHVAQERFSLDILGGHGTPFKIAESLIKNRPAAGGTISSILAAEKVRPAFRNLVEVKQIIVEVHKRAKETVGGESRWNPNSREPAAHSIPYLVATALIDGTVTLRSFNDAHLWAPEVRALMQKIEVIENVEFTRAYQRLPQEHRARVTVVTCTGERLIGESGDEQDDLSAQKRDVQIAEKFRGLTEDVLGKNRVNTILDRLWHLEELGNVAEIPTAFILD